MYDKWKKGQSYERSTNYDHFPWKKWRKRMIFSKVFFFRSDAGVGYIFILTIGLLLSFLPPSFRFPMLVLKKGNDGQVEKNCID